MAKLVAYYRVSTEGQRENTSLESQRERVARFASMNGHEIIWHFSDVETASGKKKRIGFERAIRAVETGGADGLICARLDRFARNTVEGLQIASRWHTLNKQLVIIDLGLDTTSAIGQAMFTVLLAFAQMEREVISERTRLGRDRILSVGGRPGGGPPFGYVCSRDEQNIPQLIQNPDEYFWLSKMKALRESGCSYVDIANQLNTGGSVTKLGRRWRGSHVRHALLRGDPRL